MPSDRIKFFRKLVLKRRAVRMVWKFHFYRKKIKQGGTVSLPLEMELLLNSGKRSIFSQYQDAYRILKLKERQKLHEHPAYIKPTPVPVPMSASAPTKRKSLRELEDERGLMLFNEQQREFTREELRERIVKFGCRPQISVIMPVYNTPVKWLEAAIQSLLNQVYENWELCAVDDCSRDGRCRALLEKYATLDSRIKVHVAEKNGGISAVSNIALHMAQGEYVALLDHDDELTSDALFWMVHEINEYPLADFIYSDEGKICDTAQRRLFDFFLKPDWSPELLLNVMYTCHLTVYQTALVKAAGGFRSEYDFSQDYDLALRLSEQARCICHVERILYLWRAIDGSAAKSGKSDARIGNLSALTDAMRRRQVNATIIRTAVSNRVKVNLTQVEKVSIIIPTDSYANLKKAIDTILAQTEYANYEIVAVCNSKLADTILAEYAYCQNVAVSRYDRPCNFSGQCNQGAEASTGEMVLFYNDKVHPTNSGWLGELVGTLALPGVGGVSPGMIDETGAVQYNGIVVGVPGLTGVQYHGVPVNLIAVLNCARPQWLRNVSVLSGACCLLKKKIFEEIGGFDVLNTPNERADVDLSFKLIERGWRCVYTPRATLTQVGNHVGENSKGKHDIYCLKRWGNRLAKDPYYTDSMRRMLYNNFPWNYKIYPVPAKTSFLENDVLLISHEMSLTEAPRMLLHAAIEIKRSGKFPVVISPADGPIRKEFVEAGITVIIDESVLTGHRLFEQFAKNFDLIIVNTLRCYSVINQMSRHDIPLVWWIHEETAAINTLKQQHGEGLSSALQKVSGVKGSFSKITAKVDKYLKR